MSNSATKLMKTGLKDLESIQTMCDLFKEIMEKRLISMGFDERTLKDYKIQNITTDSIPTLDVDMIENILIDHWTVNVDDRESLREAAMDERSFLIDSLKEPEKPEEEPEVVNDDTDEAAEPTEKTEEDTKQAPPAYIPIFKEIVADVEGELTEDKLTLEHGYRALMAQVKAMQLEIHNVYNQYDDLKSQINEATIEYQKSAVSNEARERRNEIIENMHEEYDKLPDGLEKTKLARKIKHYESIKTLSFVTERFTNPKEKAAIIRGFFTSTVGRCVISKFNSKIAKFGYTTKIFKVLLNLEEKYLEEKYHPFNNLFLFYYMRFVGHMNPYNIEEAEKVAALTTELLGLVYKQFTDAEAEEEFKNVIRSFDDIFEDDVERFKEDNATYPKSKYRLEKDAVYAEKRKESLLQALNILDPENTRGYKDDMSVDELDQIFKAAQKELDETQAKDYKSLNTSVETVTDTEGNDITVIKPNIITNAEAAESNDMNEAEESVIDSDKVSDENY